MSIRITELDAITSLQSGDYIAVDNESTGTHKFDALNIGANIGQNIANTYSSSASYAIGQYCLYDNNLYKCTTTISTPEAWNSSHWIQVTVGEGLYEKVDKVSGKGLSTNDFTNEYKQKLGGIEAGAEVNVQANWAETNTSSDSYIKNKPGNATTSASGFMSASDKQKLDNIEAGAEVNVQPNWAEDDSSKDDYIKNKPTIDTALSTSSDNAVRNSAITAGINQVQGNLDTEITNRQNAVSGEQLARENADSALDGRLDTVEETLPNKANINGSYEEMTVGSAEQLISTESIEDTTLYTFRASGGGIDIGDRETDKLVGGTVAWNQLADARKYRSSGTVGSLTVTNNGDGTMTINGTLTNAYVDLSSTMKPNFVQGHQYLFIVPTVASGISSNLTLYGSVFGSKAIAHSTILTAQTSAEETIYPRIWNLTATPATLTDYKYYMNCIDLTQMFGSTIADYIYSLEQAEAGSGVAWFRKYFPKPYYAYDSGSLQSVNVASHDMTGFNQWDEEWETYGSSQIKSKNLIPLIAGATYYLKVPAGIGGTIYFKEDVNIPSSSSWSGANDTFIVPSNCHYGIFYAGSGYGTTYNHDICINRVWTGNRNGEYEPYELHSYAYDESVELRGMPSLVDGELVYDGDTYEADGTVNRKWGYVDLGTLTWTLGNDTAVRQMFYATLSDIKVLPDTATVPNMVSTKFKVVSTNATWVPYVISQGTSTSITICVNPSQYVDATAFKSAMSGEMLVYELATPTSEQATGFTNPQVVDAFGTEEYVDAGVKNGTRDVSIPVGHVTQYMANLRDKLQHLPNLAKEDGDYFVNQIGAQMKLKKVEGYYEDLVSGMADNLTTKIRSNDQTPYLFRTSGGSVDIGDREYINGIVGGTVAWNQLIQNGNFADVSVWAGSTYTVADNVATFTSSQYNGLRQDLPVIGGHKYLAIAEVNAPSTSQIWLNIVVGGTNHGGGNSTKVGSGAWQTHSNIVAVSSNSIARYFVEEINSEASVVKAKNCVLFDLTQMFGSTIADYIYSLETANAGAGVAFFKSLFPKPYYAYNAGELKSVKGLVSHDMVGFNAWDEEWELGGLTWAGGQPYSATDRIRSKNYCGCVPNTSYFGTTNFAVFFYDINKTFISYSGTPAGGSVITTPSNAYYFKVLKESTTTYNHDICINLSWDGSEDGNYEPYQKWSYPLDSDLELRGIPKISNGNLYYDGDVYLPSGEVTRKIKHYLFDGSSDENWNLQSINDAGIANFSIGIDGYKNDIYTNWYPICNRFMPQLTTIGQTTTEGYFFSSGNVLFIRISSTKADSVSAFRTWLASNNVEVEYMLATPTTETADPYTSPQIVNDFGTEEFVIDDTIDVPIPVGHNTDYPINLKSKLEMAPDSPDGDGDYIVRQTNGTNEYVPLIIEDQLPAVPSADGTYTLTVTIASGEATYSWT